MLFRTLSKHEFRRLVDHLLGRVEVVGPKRIDTDVRGRPIHQYLPVQSFDEIDLDYESTSYSAKTYFLPFREKLSVFSFSGHDWEQSIPYRIQPRAIIGLHPCDVNALLKLDKVLASDLFPNPYYVSRRKNTFIIGLDCKPCDEGFCKSVDTDTVTHGFDLFLTDLGERYFVKIGSDRAFGLLQEVETREITDEDSQDYIQYRREFDACYANDVPTQDLPNLLDIEFESEVWKKWGSKCLSCGSCAMVCPTCYCYGVSERVSMDSSQSTKIKQLYSCNLLDFARVAGGHNFRPDPEIRLKYRYYHQHRGFVESFGDPMCVGCDRCGRTCLSGINPGDVIRDLHAEHR